MTITQFDLKLANYIHNNERVSLAKCASFFHKSESSIKRGIYNLNEYLSKGKRFLLEENIIFSRIDYQDYLALCAVDISSYSSTPEERHQLVFLTLILKDYIPLSKLYETLGLSDTTRKNDRKSLEQHLQKQGSRLYHQPGSGLRLEGNERQLRMQTAVTLLPIIELDEANEFRARHANTPIQRLIASVFFEAGAPFFAESNEQLLAHVFHDEHRWVDYPSKKLLYLYDLLTRIRLQLGHPLSFESSALPEAPSHHLYHLEAENRHFDYLVLSLNYKEPLDFPYDQRVEALTLQLLEQVEHELKLEFYARYGPYRYLYAYLMKSYIRNYLGYTFYDEHYSDTKNQFHELYDVVKQFAPKIEHALQIELVEHQYTDICLIIMRYLLRNQLHGQRTKRIVIISNYSSEKIDYFTESLKANFDVTLAGSFTINELYQLKHVTFDEILTFSHRVRTVLLEAGYPSRKIPFYLTKEALEELEQANYSSAHNTKLRAIDIVRELEGKLSLEEKTSYLLQQYPTHFI